jgi:hypothetical protein
VYFIEKTQKSKKLKTQFTLSFNVTKPTGVSSRVSAINITYDFREWYENNKKTLPFYAPPPIIEEDEITLD